MYILPVYGSQILTIATIHAHPISPNHNSNYYLYIHKLIVTLHNGVAQRKPSMCVKQTRYGSCFEI